MPSHSSRFCVSLIPILFKSLLLSSSLYTMPSDTPSSDLDPYSHFLTPGTSPTPAPHLPSPNHAAVLLRKGSLQVLSLSLPSAIPPSFLLVAIKALGICGSDVHYLQHGELGPFTVTGPMIIGHECAGLVVAVGSAVTTHKAGDRVALEPGIACHRCHQCVTGRYNLCPDIEFFATPPYHGSLARYVLHPAALCFTMPQALTYAQGAFCEPMSVGVWAALRGEVKPGHKVAVMGAGPIGLITMLVCRAFGASRVVVTDVSPDRLRKAKEVAGADGRVVEVGKKAVEEVVKECLQVMDGQVDVAFDCVGMASTANTALALTRSGGVVVAIGMAEPRQLLNASEIGVREVDVRGIFRYRHTYPTCIDLLASGRVDVKPLITHTMKASEGDGEGWSMKQDVILDGFEIARTGRDGAIKVMFEL